jgi:hypothetical protein
MTPWEWPATCASVSRAGGCVCVWLCGVCVGGVGGWVAGRQRANCVPASAAQQRSGQRRGAVVQEAQARRFAACRQHVCQARLAARLNPLPGGGPLPHNTA